MSVEAILARRALSSIRQCTGEQISNNPARIFIDVTGNASPGFSLGPIGSDRLRGRPRWA